MYKNNTHIKIAVQKEGRLTEDSLFLLRKAGLKFENYKQRLLVSCKNEPVDILYVRDDDIPSYVMSGAADLGIVGQNMVYESSVKVKKLLNLRFGFCTLSVAVPEDSPIMRPEELSGKAVATSYPRSTKKYFDTLGIKTKVIKISGSVEVAPSAGISDAIVDLVASGNTLKLNGLKKIADIYQTEAVLIANKKPKEAQPLVDSLFTRLKIQLSAKNYKYLSCLLSLEKVNDLRKEVPELKQPREFTYSEREVQVEGLIKEELFWKTAQKLKNIGASRIRVWALEQYLN